MYLELSVSQEKSPTFDCPYSGEKTSMPTQIFVAIVVIRLNLMISL
ncbi:MAG: hypothetical protein PWQ54_1905 [Bacteroidales bacterium]|jgi:hypothetical protein|nr:hypothetical protein [Bacteroidales bacterium]